MGSGRRWRRDQRGTIVVAGALAQRPGVPGHAWVFLHYLLGFRLLGYDVVFIDRLAPEQCTDVSGRRSPVRGSVQAAWLGQVMARVGLTSRWSLACGSTTLGLDDHAVERALRGSVLLLDVMGYLDAERRHLAPHRAFLDIDPGFGQMWQAQGTATLLGDHHHYISVGTNLGRPDCAVPTLGLEWIATLPPVVLSQWPLMRVAANEPLTTIATWRGPFAPVELDGQTYGLRVHEFRSFWDLPRKAQRRFVAALDIDDADQRDSDRLVEGGWTVVSPRAVAADIDSYREFVQRSAGEILIAKNMYVRARSGWVSDRSPCYLASGHPVFMQDTGIDPDFATRAGLLLFSSPDEAVELVKRVRPDAPEVQARAREAAESIFAAEVVLGELLILLELRDRGSPR